LTGFREDERFGGEAESEKARDPEREPGSEEVVAEMPPDVGFAYAAPDRFLGLGLPPTVTAAAIATSSAPATDALRLRRA
jgi:hypothetical protein